MAPYDVFFSNATSVVASITTTPTFYSPFPDLPRVTMVTDYPIADPPRAHTESVRCPKGWQPYTEDGTIFCTKSPVGSPALPTTMVTKTLVTRVANEAAVTQAIPPNVGSFHCKWGPKWLCERPVIRHSSTVTSTDTLAMPEVATPTPSPTTTEPMRCLCGNGKNCRLLFPDCHAVPITTPSPTATVAEVQGTPEKRGMGLPPPRPGGPCTDIMDERCWYFPPGKRPVAPMTTEVQSTPEKQHMAVPPHPTGGPCTAVTEEACWYHPPGAKEAAKEPSDETVDNAVQPLMTPEDIESYTLDPVAKGLLGVLPPTDPTPTGEAQTDVTALPLLLPPHKVSPMVVGPDDEE